MDAVTDKESDGLEGMQIVSESKKDPSQRRHELLIKSDLAEVMPVTKVIYMQPYHYFKKCVNSCNMG